MGLRLQEDLDAAVLFALEDLVGVRALLKWQLVRDQVLGAQRVVVACHQRHEVIDPAFDVRLAHSELDALVEQLHHRQGVHGTAVDADDRQGAAPADGVDGIE